MSRTDLTFKQALEVCSRFKRKPLFFNGCAFSPELQAQADPNYTACSEERARELAADPRTMVIFSVGRGVRPSEIVIQEKSPEPANPDECGYCGWVGPLDGGEARGWPACQNCGGV